MPDTAPDPVRTAVPSASGHAPLPYREPLWKTLRRTLLIALGITLIITPIAHAGRSPLDAFWRLFLAVLWFPLGGHYVELGYLNLWRLRRTWPRNYPRFSRLLYWAVTGLPLGAACLWTLRALGVPLPIDLPLWWGVLFFPAVELFVHAVLAGRGHPSYWNARE